MPLGSGALAGTSFPIDRVMVACELGFFKVSENSVDAVSDRDFVADVLYGISLIMVHLSRLSEELVIWSTEEFGFIELDDAYTTGSSIMPQKKNPDVAELTRGKTGRVIGSLTGMLTVFKGLPLAYNRDLQEDKETLFDAIDTIKAALSIYSGMLSTMKLNSSRMKEAAKNSFLMATDMADYLAKQGLSFREAHEVVGKIVGYCLKVGCGLFDLSIEDFKKFSHLFEEDIFNCLNLEQSIESKISQGGTSSVRVKEEFDLAHQVLAEEEKWFASKK